MRSIAKDTSYPLLEISRKEVDIRPVFRYCNNYPLGLICLRSIRPLLTASMIRG